MGPNNDNSRAELKLQLKKHLERPIPKGIAVFIGEADVDLYEEHAYLVGLIDTFIVTGRKPLEIQINTSIDRSIDNVQPKTEREKAIIRDLVSFRQEMLELARALAVASGVPLMDWRRPEV